MLYPKILRHRKTNIATFNWDNKTPASSKHGKTNNLVRIVLFNEKLLETFTAPKSENREEGVISITIPESWLIADVHFWLFLRSQNLKDKSDSIYIKLIDDIAYFDGLAVLNKYLSKGLIHQYRQQLL